MAAYRRVYDSHHLQPDCQGKGIISGNPHSVIEYGLLFSFSHKAPGLSGLVTEMIQVTGEIGTQWMLDLCNGIAKEGSIPEDWKSSVVLPN